jgi:predicted TIM-barrel fold metal-dependent hydrolase
VTTPQQSVCAWATTLPIATAFSAADWLFAPMWNKFPKLRVALAEAGAGWVPFLIERADYAYRQHREWTNMDLGKDMPSDIFRRHFIVCFLSDEFGVNNHKTIGIDNLTWECDFPHSDCTWPNSPEVAWESVKNLSDEDINKVTHLNALREFSFDPFQAIPRERATVGALRHAARHIDTSPTYHLGGRKPGNGGPVTMGDLAKMMETTQ